MVGERLGAYTILSKLGEGGMGAVYLAEHAQLGHRVAVKMLLPELSTNDDVVRRFFAEAKAASKVRHSSIVQIFDFGKHATGGVYFVMELLECDSLRSRLGERGILSAIEACNIGRQIAKGLAAAHEKGIVHRDLKPENIMLLPDSEVAGGDRVKILDFGVAKFANEIGQLSAKTRTGTLLGTPVYMAPEQCRGAGNVDYRADIYSLGCVLFEMVCGQPPFLGEGIGDIIGAHLHVPPPMPRSLNASIPAALEAVILRALAKPAGERQPSMADLANDLLMCVDPSGRILLPGTSNPPMARVSRNMSTAADPMARRQPITTLRSSVGEMAGARVRGVARKRRWPWVAGATVGSTLVAIGLAMTLAGGGPAGSKPGPTASVPTATTGVALPDKPGVGNAGDPAAATRSRSDAEGSGVPGENAGSARSGRTDASASARPPAPPPPEAKVDPPIEITTRSSPDQSGQRNQAGSPKADRPSEPPGANAKSAGPKAPASPPAQAPAVQPLPKPAERTAAKPPDSEVDFIDSGALLTEAKSAAQAGRWDVARTKSEQVLKDKPEDQDSLKIAAMAACKQSDRDVARKHIAHIGGSMQARVTAFCEQNGVRLSDTAPSEEKKAGSPKVQIDNNPDARKPSIPNPY